MAGKILNSFDVWIAAQGWKSKLRLKSVDNVSLEGIAKLRELILELAVRGKLVPQNLKDEPARVLMDRISKGKEKLVKTGKIKKQEPLSEIESKDAAFDLPSEWIWTKLGNLSSNVHYGYTASADENNKEVRLLRITDIQNSSVDWGSVPGCEIDSENVSDYLLENGDILIARTGGTIGKSYLVSNITVRSVFASYLIRVKRLDEVYPEFIKVFLGSKLYWDQLFANSMGTGQPNVNGNALKNLTVPLPPLAEQHRIVAKVDELMALCDELEQQETNHLKSHQLLVETLLGTLTQAKDATEFQTAWATLAQHFDDLFITEDSIDQLKQTILQLAVMGKLVKQDPKDEPVKELLKKISKEKERQIDAKEIKKQKPVLGINEDEKPFDIPKGWEWRRLDEIGRFTGGGTPSMSRSDYWDGDIPWISPKDMGEKYVSDSEMKITSQGVENSPAKLIPKGSLLIVARSGILKRRLPVSINTTECTVNQDIKVLIPYAPEINTFLLLMFCGLEKLILDRYVKIGTTVHSLKYESFEMMPIPIPPIPEQHRIITQVDELFAICDRLKERIGESQKVVNQMADSILEQVV